MHEMSIAESILQAVAAETARVPHARPTRVGVRIGELAGIDPESLHFCFEAIVKDSEFDGLQLEIESRARRHRCLCGTEFAVDGYEFTCPTCGYEATSCISGDELELAFVEVEEHEPSAAGA
jgi:hydrogenase nickel incorporation protein HypA/HybF